jgi:ATP-binding cassette, subfamily B, bacterial
MTPTAIRNTPEAAGSAPRPQPDEATPVENKQSPWRERVSALKNVPPVLGILWDSGPAVVTWGIILRVVVAAVPALIGFVASRIIAYAAGAIRHQPLPSWFWYLVGTEVLLAIFANALNRIIDYLDSLLADRYTNYVSVRVMRQAATLDLTTYEDPVFYDRLERARVQATDRLAMIQGLGRLILQVVSTAIFTGILMWHSPWLVLLLTLGVIPSFIGETHYAFLGYAKNFRQTPAKRQMDYLRQVAGSREGAKELKLFNLAEYLTGRFSTLSQQIYEENVALSRRKLIGGGIFTMIGTLGYYGSYAFVIWRAVNGQIDLGTLYFLTTSIIQAQSSLQQVFSTASGIADQALFLTDLLAFFDMKPTVTSNPTGALLNRPIQRGFEFINVSFTYPGTERRVLSNFNFTLSPGERIALIGENGQGKTTVVKLITRLYDPTEGQILLDGKDLRDYKLEDLHHEIGVIFQDFMRYEMTAGENIAVGRVERKHSQAELEDAAHKSLAESVIHKLPGGYDQMLGRRFETGVELSGGEWQRVALARAYLRDAQLLILDEPTAALDARSELEVFERFSELTKGKMALLISHRFSTVRMADRIVVLAGGKLIEEGTHQQLMLQNGQYAAMFEMQAASYR